MSGSTRRNRLALQVVILCSVLLLAACTPGGESGDAVAGEMAGEKQNPPDIASSVTAPTTATTEIVVAPSEQIFAPLPTATDPCVEPAAHEVGWSDYGFMFEGEERPVGVRVGGDTALSEPVVFVGLHGANRTWKDIPFLMNEFGLDSMVAPRDRVVIFAPQAQSGPGAFWGQSDSFNVDYLADFFALVARSVCLNDSKVILFGTGQGVVVAAEGVCRSDLPVDLMLLLQGLVKLTGCSPSKPIPIVSVDQYEFHPQLGAHWDGSWNPPGQIEMDLTGGFGSTPDDLAVWADVYNCTDIPTEEEIAYTSGVIERPTSVLAYRDCDATLVAFGMESAEDDFFPSDAAVSNVRSRLAFELRSALGEG